jgi:hypothetical protein
MASFEDLGEACVMGGLFMNMNSAGTVNICSHGGVSAMPHA